MPDTPRARDRRAGPDRHVDRARGEAALARRCRFAPSTGASRSTRDRRRAWSSCWRRRSTPSSTIMPQLPRGRRRRRAGHRHRQHQARDHDRGGDGRRCGSSSAGIRWPAARAGAAGARADLFDGRPWFLTNPDAPDAVRRAVKFVEALGAQAGGARRSRRGARSADGRGQPPAAGGGQHADGASWRARSAPSNLQWAGDGLRDTTRLAASQAGDVAEHPRDQQPRAEAAAQVPRAPSSSPFADRLDDPEAVEQLFDEANARQGVACPAYNSPHEQSAGDRRRGGRRHSRRRHDHDGRLRPVRHSRTPDRRAASPRHEGPHHHQQQRRHRRLRRRAAAHVAPGPQDDRDLRRREQGVRAPVPAEGDRGRAGAAGHVLRAHARRRAPASAASSRRPAPAR